MATYSGIDKVGEFFAHYGRKGMKRGMNIFNPNYKPIGEKAQGTSDGKIAQRSISAKPTTYKSVDEKAKGAMTGDPRYSNSPRISVTGVQSSAKDREREAMNAASQRASAIGAKEQEIKNTEERLNASKDDDLKSVYAMLISDRYEPTAEQIDSINSAFEKAIQEKESALLQEILRDNSKKVLAMKALTLMNTRSDSYRNLVKKAKAQANEPRIKVENDAQINVEDNTVKGREREAMNRASSAATKSGAKSAREKLLEAERKRQANIYRR